MLTEYQKQQAGKWYNSNDKEIQALQQKSRKLMQMFNNELDADKRSGILKEWVNEVGKESYIEPPVFIDFGCHVCLGKKVYLNTGCTFLDSATVSIGDYTLIGPNVQFLTPEHPLQPEQRVKSIIKEQEFEIAKPIKIGKGCWICSGAIIFPGVTIGDGVTIGAGSVVTNDIPPRCLAYGNPCKVIKYFD